MSRRTLPILVEVEGDTMVFRLESGAEVLTLELAPKVNNVFALTAAKLHLMARLSDIYPETEPRVGLDGLLRSQEEFAALYGARWWDEWRESVHKTVAVDLIPREQIAASVSSQRSSQTQRSGGLDMAWRTNLVSKSVARCRNCQA